MSSGMRALAPGIALSALALFQPWLEQRMLTHMLIELPLLFAIGWQFARYVPRGRLLSSYNASGLTGLMFVMLVSAFWMMPLALDMAVLDPVIGWLKVVSVCLAGFLARVSMAKARMPVQAFFVLNWVWMTAAVGVVYQQVPERLCSTYLLGDQANAGVGLVLLAVVVAGTWIVMAFREKVGMPRGHADSHAQDMLVRSGRFSRSGWCRPS